jgi:hypothetical protein
MNIVMILIKRLFYILFYGVHFSFSLDLKFPVADLPFSVLVSRSAFWFCCSRFPRRGANWPPIFRFRVVFAADAVLKPSVASARLSRFSACSIWSFSPVFFGTAPGAGPLGFAAQLPQRPRQIPR